MQPLLMRSRYKHSMRATRFTIAVLVLLVVSSLPLSYGETAPPQEMVLADFPMETMDQYINAYEGPAFDKDKAAETVAYRRTWDGGYSQDLANQESTYLTYWLLNSLTTLNADEIANFDQYINERYSGAGWAGFNNQPNTWDVGSHAGYLMATLYNQLGYTLPSTFVSNLENDLDYHLYDRDWIDMTTIGAAIFVNAFGITVDLAQVASNLATFQNTDLTSSFYGAIGRNNYDTSNQDNYRAEFSFSALFILDLLGINPTTVFDLSILDNYLDRMRTDNLPSSISWNYANLDYNETYKETVLNDLSENEFRYNTWVFRNTQYAIAARTLIDDYISSNYSVSSASDMVLYHTYNTYWLDENNDNIIDREPTLMYFSPSFDFQQFLAFGTIINELSLGAQVNIASIRDNLASYMLDEGGVTDDRATIEHTNAALSVMYHLDREGTYLDTLGTGLDESLNWLKSLQIEYWEVNFEDASWANATAYARDKFYHANHMESYASPWYGYGSEEEAKHVLDIFNKLDRLSDLSSDTMLWDGLKSYFRKLSEDNLYNYHELIRPEEAFNLLEATEILGTQNSINFSKVITDLPKFQLKSGGFNDYQYWYYSLEQAIMYLSMNTAFNHTQYQEIIKAELVETTFEQGLPWYRGDDYVEDESTARMVVYLKMAGILDDWIAAGILNSSKLIDGISNGHWGSMGGYTRIDPYIHDMGYAIEALSYLGADFGDIDAVGYDINEVIRYVSDLQVTSAEATAQLPEGSFKYRLLENGGFEYYYALESTYNALKIIDITGSWAQIDSTAAIAFVQNMQNTNPSDWQYGMFYYNPGDTWCNLKSTYYGVLSAELLGASIINNWDYLDDNVYFYNQLRDESLYEDSMHFAVGLVGHGAPLAKFNTTLLNIQLEYRTTMDGFLTRKGDMYDTYYAAKSLKTLNAYDQIDVDKMYEDIVSLQYPNETRVDAYYRGGFAYNTYYAWGAELSNTQMALEILFRDKKLDLIDGTMAVKFVNNRYENLGNSPNYFDASMQNDILPAVRIYDSLGDVMLPQLVTQKYVYSTQMIDMDLAINDIWGNEIIGVTANVTLNGTYLGEMTEMGGGHYSFSYDTTAQPLGMYNFILNLTKSGLVSNSVNLWVEVRENVLMPQVNFATPLMEGTDLDVFILVEDALEQSLTPSVIEINFMGTVYTPSFNAASGEYEVTLPYASLPLGIHSFDVHIEVPGYSDFDHIYEVSVEDILLQWTTRSQDTTLDMNEPWIATGEVRDQMGLINNAEFSFVVEGPSGDTGETVGVSVDAASLYTLTLSQTDPEEGSYTITMEVSLAGQPDDAITITFEFTRENNAQTTGGETPELELLPGFEAYLAIFALLAIPVIRRKKE